MVFKPVKGFENRYLVSEIGQIFSLLSNRLLAYPTSVNNNGYKNYKLVNTTGKIITKMLHRLVAEAFIENPLNLKTVNHKDGNKKNNHYTNLEWMSQSENVQHSFDTGLSKKGSDHGQSKLTEQQVIEIKEILKTKKKGQHPYMREIAKMFNVDRKTIESINRNKTWRQI